MKSLILTALYLARDTVNRWFTRLSSPVARVLVVFFLTLCALCFLGTYVISAKVMQDRIRRQGGDLVQMTLSPTSGRSICLPTRGELEELLGADSLALSIIGTARRSDGRSVRVATYDFARAAQWMPCLAPGSTPTLLLSLGSAQLPGPTQISVRDWVADAFARRAPAGSLQERLVEHEDLLVLHPDSALAQRLQARALGGGANLLLQVRGDFSARAIERAEAYCRNYMRLEGAHGHVNSALALLREMDIILSNQVQCRVAFCAGITCIVGILLTALAGMEYRQNEYIYTLMKSFGIHPLLLVAAFIAENLILVGGSFVAAVWVFMYSQRFLVQQFFKTAAYSLELAEVMTELQLVAVSLLGCVLVSSLPIVLAANRDIGRVLK